MKRAVLYLRVSTLDQTTANQERELREVAGRMGCEIVQVYKDHGISGAKGRDKRPAFDRLCRDAAQRKFDLVMAWHTGSSTLDKPATPRHAMRVTVGGRAVAGGAQGHAIEYAGSGIAALSMEGRMTVCNMSIEAGGRCGVVAPDATTFAYLKGRPYAPKGAAFDQAVEAWSGLTSDADARFDREVALDAASIAPIVTWGTTPDDALPIDGRVPDPARETDPSRAKYVRDALDYTGIAPGKRLTEIAIDRVFIGSCTNARIEDLRAAAAVLAGRTSKVPGLVSPGSSMVKRLAEEEGLDRIFREAGLEWVESGCSMCVGINGDVVAAGERCASTTNRNFRGRQGPGARTHLMSPAMVAAAAVSGHLADVRPLLAGREL
jgi:3-isopropylmalate/(R)-2-methylmalate dehydratase large subunit